MNLLIAERLILRELLPKEHDYAGLKELRRAHELLALTPKEIDAFKVTQYEGGMIKWSDEGNIYLADIPLSEWVTTIIQEELRERNKKRKLTEREFSLYEKFIVAYDQV